MKVLVAFADDGERDALAAVLAQAEFEPVTAADGNAAVRSALGLTEPYLAVIERNLPGLSGLQVCLCLRSPKLKIRPFVVIVGAASETSETAHVLDFGADEHVAKPVETAELVARLRAASRTLQYQLELQQRIGELETLVKRYGLLGEIVAHTGQIRAQHKAAATPPAAAQPAAKPAAATQPVAPAARKPSRPVIQISLEQADEIMQRTIRELRFGNVGAIAKVVGECYAPSHLTTWAGFIVEDQEVWYELLLDVDRAAMAMIFEQTMGRPPESEQERKEFLVETHEIVSSSFKAALTGLGARVLSPILSRALPAQDLRVPTDAKAESIRYVLAGGSISFTMLKRPCPLKRKTTLTLELFDITAEDIPPPKDNEVTWLSKGSVLVARFINKLAELDLRRGNRMLIPVYPCSPIAATFLKAGPLERAGGISGS